MGSLESEGYAETSKRTGVRALKNLSIIAGDIAWEGDSPGCSGEPNLISLAFTLLRY